MRISDWSSDVCSSDLYMFDNMPSAWPHVEAGKLRALAVTTADRSKTAPDLPTMQESGYPTFDVSSWFGVIAPTGTPDEVVNKLKATILAALANPDVQKPLADLGAGIGRASCRERWCRYGWISVDAEDITKKK